MTWASAAWLSILVLLGCSSAEIITDCRPHAGLRPVCGFRNPEDLVALPDGGVLVSQMGRMDGTRPGSLVHFDPLAEELTSLFPAAGAGATVDVAAPGPASSGGAGWGAAD